MSYRFFGKSALWLSAALLSLAALAAEPSLQQVYDAAHAGNFSQAQGMMDQVLQNHPNSAKAHFVEAELQAKQGRIEAARTELATAQRLDPAMAFAKPGAVAELQSLLASPVSPAAGSFAAPVRPTAQGGLPWGLLLLGGGLIAAVVWFVRTQRRQVVAPMGMGPMGGGAQPYPAPAYGAPGYGPMAPQGGMGSSLLGGLATGAAVGAGMVAGEALMHRVFEGGHQANAAPMLDPNSVGQNPEQRYDLGGNDFGVADAGGWDSGGGGDMGGGGGDW